MEVVGGGGAGWVALFIVLYSPKTPFGRRREKLRQGRVYFEPEGFDGVFPKARDLLMCIKGKVGKSS